MNNKQYNTLLEEDETLLKKINIIETILID